MPPTVAFDARDAHAPQIRGWGIYARELIRALRTRGDFEYDEIAEGSGLEVAFEQVGLPRYLKKTGADLVHVPNCFLPLRRPCPGVVTIHDLAFERYPEDFARRTGIKYRRLTPRAARSADRVICVSEHTRDDVVERYGVDAAKTRVIYSAPSVPITDTPAPPGPYVLAVGDLREKKNLTKLALAFSRLSLDGLIPHRLVLAGLDTGAGGRLAELAAKGVPIEMPGYVSDAELDALLRGADVLAYPSLYEGFGLAIVEAMARGTPVIAANTTALPEAGKDAAEYFDPLDFDDIAGTLLNVLKNDALRDQMRQRGLARAAELSWERTAEATAGVYRELI